MERSTLTSGFELVAALLLAAVVAAASTGIDLRHLAEHGGPFPPLLAPHDEQSIGAVAAELSHRIAANLSIWRPSFISESMACQ